MWKYSRRCKNIHRSIERIHCVLTPHLPLRFRVRGHKVLLYLGDEVIWDNIVSDTRFDDITHADLANLLTEYYNTPVSKLRLREVPRVPRHWSSVHVDKLEQLLAIMLASDKRIGKGLQSIWLFTEKSSTARKISYLRIK